MPDSDNKPPAEYAEKIVSLVRSPGFVRATFAGTRRLIRGGAKLQRVVVRQVKLREGMRLQISRFDGKKDVSSNVPIPDAHEALADILAMGFANVHVMLEQEEVDIRLSKKGEVNIATKQVSNAARKNPLAHNHVKALPLPEGLAGGAADRFLLAMEMIDRGGRVRPAMRAKFTQINEFLKLLEHVLSEVTPQPGAKALPDDELLILDCGCGASHLTLATWHYLNEIKGITARVIGVDVNEEVIAKARHRAAELRGQGLDFRVAAIGAVENLKADIVLALHACDTATDDALAQGVRSDAKLILAVPCCHQNLNSRLRVAPLAPLHHHGILHERLADLVTDTFRALLLKAMGYRAEVIEFISPEHTARNIMIRAVKVRESGDRQALREYREFKAFMGAAPYLESLLPIPNA